MENRTTRPNPLATLGAHLSARRLEVELTAYGLRVDNPAIPGCCPEATPATVTITCRPRPGDDGRMWFFGPGHEPIAEADQIMIAVPWVLGRLAPRQECPDTEQDAKAASR